VEEKLEFQNAMHEWADFCESASSQFRLFQKSLSSSKVKKKRKVNSRHGKILETSDPMVPVQSLLERVHKSEPRHLERGSQSWLVWARNMTLLELMVSNPIRAGNLCALNYCEDQTGRLRKGNSSFEIVLEKHDVKNPHDEKQYGYHGQVGSSASAWLHFYLNKVRPLWSTELPTSERVFLTDSGREISVVELRSIFLRVSQLYLPEYSGLNPHVFRHIVATSWLKNNPDDFITVALILGDRIETVMRDYAHLASSDGFSRYHRSLSGFSMRNPPKTEE
jgi:site-specific recombinase XerD